MNLFCLGVHKFATKPIVGSSRVIEDRGVPGRGGDLCRLLTPTSHLTREDQGIVLGAGFGKVKFRDEGGRVHVQGGPLTIDGEESLQHREQQHISAAQSINNRIGMRRRR